MNFIKSLFLSFKKAFVANEDAQKFVKKYPRTVSFLKQRLDRTKFTGLPLSIFGIAFLYILILFFGATEDFITSDIIVSVDVLANTLLYAFRNLSAVKTFIWVTLLCESPIIVVFALVISVILWLSHKKRQIVALWLAIVGSEGIVFFAKLFFHRPRPSSAVFLEESNSFPSGHSAIAVVFYGFLAYLLTRRIKNKLCRFFIILTAVILIIAVGLSRLYLGVHYVSDVWAGYLVGLLWLIIGICISEWKLSQEQKLKNKQNSLSKYSWIIFGGLISVAVIFYIVYGLSYHPFFTDGESYFINFNN